MDIWIRYLAVTPPPPLYPFFSQAYSCKTKLLEAGGLGASAAYVAQVLPVLLAWWWQEGYNHTLPWMRDTLQGTVVSRPGPLHWKALPILMGYHEPGFKGVQDSS